MKRTTVLLDDELFLDAQQTARRRGTTFTALLDEALRAHLHTHRTPRRLSFVGMGRTEQPTQAMRDGWDEAELRANIDREHGWVARPADASAETRCDGENGNRPVRPTDTPAKAT